MAHMRQMRGRLRFLLNKFRDTREIDSCPYRVLADETIGLTSLAEAFQDQGSLDHVVDALLERFEQDVTISEESLREIIEYIINYEQGREEVDDMVAVNLFRMNCRHPAKADLIFYPDSVFGHSHPSVQEILDAAIGRT